MKNETAETIAKKAMQPGADFNAAANAKPSAQQPTVKPLPAPLAKALGQS
jgi:hypothetical protein